MIINCNVKNIKSSENGTEILLKSENYINIYDNKFKRDCLLQLEDGRNITDKQIRCIHATLRDIGDHLGWEEQYTKDYFKYNFSTGYNIHDLSFANCSIKTANDFITYLIDFVLYYNIPVSAKLWSRTKDIYTYLALCLINKKCAVSGNKGEIHELSGSRIGMGNNRKTVDMDEREQICLSREYHTEIHYDEQAFLNKYKFFGIKHKEWMKFKSIYTKKGKWENINSLYL